MWASSITDCPSAGTPLLICATCDSSITSNAKAATIENTIAAITQIESYFYNPVAINIGFDDPTVSGLYNLGSDVGANDTSNYINRPDDVAALLHLPQTATDPVNGNTDTRIRYDTNGNRAFSPSTAAFLEITPGTQIAQFNSSAGLDYADWSGGSGQGRVQDATGTTAKPRQVNFSTAEIQALSVIGYDTVPEPSTGMRFCGGTMVYGLWRKFRQ